MNNDILPHYLHRTDMCYRSFSHKNCINVIGCGFFLKSGVSTDNLDSFYSHYALVYVLRGRGQFIDHEGNCYDLYPGAVFQRNPNYKHTLLIDPDSDWSEVFIGMKNTIINDPEVRNKILASKNESWKSEVERYPNNSIQILESLNIINTEQPVFYPGVKLDIVRALDDLLHRLKTANESQLQKMQLEILNIISDFNSIEIKRRSCSFEEQLVKDACEKIINDICNRTPFPKLFVGLGLSYSRLRSIFKKLMGVSPGSYRIQRRIDYACSLLSDTSDSIQSISYTLGYKDQFSFAAQFKQVTGVTPNNFRKEILSNY